MDRYFSALKKTRGKLLALQNVVGIGVGYKTSGAEDTGDPCFVIYVQKSCPPGICPENKWFPEKLTGSTRTW